MNSLHASRDWIAGITRLIPTWVRVTTILLIILLVIGGLVVYYGLAANIWDWLQSFGSGPEESNGSGLAESNSTTLRNFGLLLGGFIAVILAIWRSSVAERQAKAALDQAFVAQTQANTAQESLRHDRYQRGAEMLGSQLLPVRLAGISALKRLAADYPEEYHLQVMELFCGFVRTPTGEQENLTWETDDLERIPYSLSRHREDVQAVMTAIGARGGESKALEEADGFTLNLQGANLTHVSLQNSDLAGANLRRAKLPAVHAIEVNLSGAALIGALLYRMTGDRINLSGADLVGANMVDMLAENTNFSNATLYGANLKGACLNGSDFSGAILGHNDLTTTRLEQADFSGVHISPGIELTQDQLDKMKAAPENPPEIVDGSKDSFTAKPLVWRGVHS